MDLTIIKIIVSLLVCAALVVLSVESSILQPKSGLPKMNSTSVKQFLATGWNRLAFNVKSEEGDIQLSALMSNNQLRDGLWLKRCLRLNLGLRGRRDTQTADHFKTNLAYEFPDEPLADSVSSGVKTTAKAVGAGQDRRAIERCLIGLGKPRNLRTANIYKLVLTMNNKATQQMSLNDTLANALTKLKSTLHTLGQIQANNQKDAYSQAHSRLVSGVRITGGHFRPAAW